jgi:hypothetical protein
VQDDCAVGGAAHPRVRDADHVPHAAGKKPLWQRGVADFGHSGVAAWSAPSEDQDVGLVDVEGRGVDAGAQVLYRVEDDGAATPEDGGQAAGLEEVFHEVVAGRA